MILKVCGMRDPKNIQQLTELQPDWMGMIFYEKSPRHISESIDPNITLKKIGVFVNATKDYIDQRINEFQLAGVQFHGKETPQFCESYKQKGLITIKAFSVKEENDFEITSAYEGHCDYYIFDTKGKNPGGNGISYDWNILKQYKGNTPFLLSGGIAPALLADIKKFKHPQWVGIDINSGFEIAPGLKDIALIKKFKHDLSN